VQSLDELTPTRLPNYLKPTAGSHYKAPGRTQQKTVPLLKCATWRREFHRNITCLPGAGPRGNAASPALLPLRDVIAVAGTPLSCYCLAALLGLQQKCYIIITNLSYLECCRKIRLDVLKRLPRKSIRKFSEFYSLLPEDILAAPIIMACFEVKWNLLYHIYTYVILTPRIS
jgi:hypothetical protein